MSDAGFAPTIARFSGGFADNYDRCRAEPPAVLADYLGRLAGSSPPDLVVDLGSGTGLSTRYWAERARRVIGVEPSDEMRALAEARTRRANVSYRRGFSHRTGLADRSADVAFCMQALHWMDPQRTFDEAARILRPGGVFAACDYDWPPATGAFEADAAWLSAKTGRPYRLPSEAEKAKLLAALDEAGAERREVVEDLYWSILSSKEFLFNH